MDRINAPGLVPGEMYLRGLILYEKGEYQESLDALAKYHAQVGYDLETLDYVAGNYAQLGQHDKELTTQWLVLRSGDNDALDRIVPFQGVEALDTVFSDQRLAKMHEGSLAEFANKLSSYPIFEDELKAIVAHFESQDPSSKNFHSAAGALDFILGDFKNGIQHFQEAWEKDQGRYSLLSLASDGGQLDEVLKNSPDLLEDFKIVSDIYEDDGSVSRGQFESAVKLLASQQPESILASFWAGQLALDSRDFERAISNLTKTLDHPERDELLTEYQVDDAKSQLIFSLLETGQSEKALKTAEQDTDQLVALAKLVLKDSPDDELVQKILERLDGQIQQTALKAQIQLSKNDYSQAAKSYATVLEEVLNENSNYWSGRHEIGQLIEACRLAGEPLDAFENCNHPNMLVSLADRLIADADWNRALQLIDNVQDKLENAPKQWNQEERNQIKSRILFLQLTMHWHQQQYEKVVTHFPAYKQAASKADWAVDKDVMIWAIRSAVRSEHPISAMKFVEGKSDDDHWNAANAFVELLRKDFDRYRELNQSLYGKHSDFHTDDQDVILTADEFQQATGKYRPLPGYPGPPEVAVKIGSGSEAAISTTSLTQWLKNNDLDGEFTQLPNVEDGSTNKIWLLNASGTTVIVTLRNQPSQKRIHRMRMQRLPGRNTGSQLLPTGITENQRGNWLTNWRTTLRRMIRGCCD